MFLVSFLYWSAGHLKTDLSEIKMKGAYLCSQGPKFTYPLTSLLRHPGRGYPKKVKLRATGIDWRYLKMLWLSSNRLLQFYLACRESQVFNLSKVFIKVMDTTGSFVLLAVVMILWCIWLPLLLFQTICLLYQKYEFFDKQVLKSYI